MHDVYGAHVYPMLVEGPANACEGSRFIRQVEDDGIRSYGAYPLLQHRMKSSVVIVGPEGNHAQFAYGASINVFDVDVRVAEGLGNAIQRPRLMGDQRNNTSGRFHAVDGVSAHGQRPAIQDNRR